MACFGGGNDVQRQTNEPSDWSKGFLNPGMEEAKTLFGQGPSKHYTEDNGSAIQGFGQQSDAALNQMFGQGMGGQQQRAGATNALNMFTGGGAIDGDTINGMRGIGASNAYQNSPGVTGKNSVYGELERLNAGNGMNLSGNMHGRIGDLAQTGGVDPMMGRMEGLMSGGGMNLSKNLFDRIGGLTQDGGNIAGRADSQLGNLLSTGGNVAGYSGGKVDDITASGAGSNSQIRGDINDLITGQAQAANPAFQSLGLTASGAMLGGNPFLDSMYDRAADRVTRDFRTSTSPSIDGRFAMTSGGSGSGAAALARDSAERNLGDTLGGLATSVYGGNYGQERDRQLSAASTLGGQYLQGQGLRASTAGQSASQASDDARLRLAATGQVAGDMAGDQARKMQAIGMSTDAASQDLARKMQASQQMTGAEQTDWQNLMGGMDRMSSMYNQSNQNRMQAANQMMGAEQTDWTNLTGNLDRMSNMNEAGINRAASAYESGADRQLQGLTSANSANLAGRNQQLQSLGLMPQWQQMQNTDTDRALAAGGARDALGQKQLDERVQAFDFGQNSPWNNVQRYLAATGGGNMGTTQSMTGGGPSPLSSILQAGGGIGNMAMMAKMLGMF